MWRQSFILSVQSITIVCGNDLNIQSVSVTISYDPMHYDCDDDQMYYDCDDDQMHHDF